MAIACSENHADARRLKDLGGVLDRAAAAQPDDVSAQPSGSRIAISATWRQALDTMLPAAVRDQAGTRRVTLILSRPERTLRARMRRLKLSAKQSQVLRYLAEAANPARKRNSRQRVRCTAGPITALTAERARAVRRRARAAGGLCQAAGTPRETITALNEDQRGRSPRSWRRVELRPPANDSCFMASRAAARPRCISRRFKRS